MYRLLIVDDNATNREILSEVLLDSNYQLEDARDGQEALEKARANPPDLILLDCLMPNLDGVETLRRLRSESRTANVPIIMVTALGQETQLAVCMDEGANDYVVRPFSHIVLRARVRAALRNRNATSSLKPDRGPRTRPSAPTAPKHELRDGKLICVIGTKGGVGTSYVALTLATLTAMQKQETVNVVELRSWAGSLAATLGIQPSSTIAQLISKRKRTYTDDDIRSALTVHQSGLRLLLAPTSDTATPDLSAAAAERLLHALSDTAATTVVDLPTFTCAVTKRAVMMSDQTILVIEPDLVCLAAARGWLAQLSNWEVPKSALSVVVVRKSGDAPAVDAAEIKAALGAPVVGVIEPDPNGILLKNRLASCAEANSRTCPASGNVVEASSQGEEDELATSCA